MGLKHQRRATMELQMKYPRNRVQVYLVSCNNVELQCDNDRVRWSIRLPDWESLSTGQRLYHVMPSRAFSRVFSLSLLQPNQINVQNLLAIAPPPRPLVGNIILPPRNTALLTSCLPNPISTLHHVIEAGFCQGPEARH